MLESRSSPHSYVLILVTYLPRHIHNKAGLHTNALACVRDLELRSLTRSQDVGLSASDMLAASARRCGQFCTGSARFFALGRPCPSRQGPGSLVSARNGRRCTESIAYIFKPRPALEEQFKVHRRASRPGHARRLAVSRRMEWRDASWCALPACHCGWSGGGAGLRGRDAAVSGGSGQVWGCHCVDGPSLCVCATGCWPDVLKCTAAEVGVRPGWACGAGTRAVGPHRRVSRAAAGLSGLNM